jgi:UPF0716 protein FxsA
MPVFLVLVFVLVPLAEILVILQVGEAIGGWWTAALLVADSLLGAYLLRVEGRRAWSEFRSALEEGRWPGDEVAQGALVIVGGTLLLTPGFLTDALGFLFLLGPTRRMVARRLRARVSQAAGSGTATSSGRAHDARGSSGRRRHPGRTSRTPEGDEVVLDVEVVEIRREQREIDPSDGIDRPCDDEVEDDDAAAETDDDVRP